MNIYRTSALPYIVPSGRTSLVGRSNPQVETWGYLTRSLRDECHHINRHTAYLYNVTAYLSCGAPAM